MGACVKCGKETNNVYAYHTAKLIAHQHLNTTYSGNTRTEHYRDSYTDIEHHSDYLCTRCAYGRDYAQVLAFAIGGTVFCLALVALLIVSVRAHNPTVSSGFVMLGLSLAATVGAWLGWTHERKAIKEDRHFKEGKSSASKGELAVKELAMKERPGCTYFTPEEYRKLSVL